MKALIDTNIFIYASYTQFPQHKRARDFLKSCLQGLDTWYLSWSTVYEYLCVATNPILFKQGVLPLEKAVENVLRFSESNQIEFLNESSDHRLLLSQLSHQYKRLSGSILHDFHTVVLMQEHDIKRIYTADTDFYKFKGIEIINPTA